MLKYTLIAFLFFFNTTVPNKHWLTEDVANKIAQKIYPLLGGTGQCPAVIFGYERELAVYYGGADNRIVISEILRDSLESNLGVDAETALAIIIGHELWHAINKQSGKGFGKSDGQGRLSEAEKSSDLHGLFGAELAGYDRAADIFDKMMEKLTPLLKKDSVPLPERKQQDDELVKKVKIAVQFFDLGTGFLLRQQGTEDFEIARTCYQIVAEDLASIPDVQYNLGMTYLLQALHECEFKYLLPAEINSGSFAQAIRGPSTQDHNGKDVTDLLTKAEVHFDQANKQQGQRYYDAFIANFCVQTVRNKQGENAGVLEKWLNENRTASIEHYRKMQLIYAVALLRKGERDTAVNLLESLAGTNDIIGSFASINLKKVGPQKPEKYEDRKPIRWDIVRDAQKLENLDSKKNWVVINTQFSYLIEEGQIKSVRYGYGNILGVDAVMAEPSWPQKGAYQTGSGAYGHLTGTQGETTSCDFFFKTNNSGGIQSAWRIFYYRK